MMLGGANGAVSVARVRSGATTTTAHPHYVPLIFAIDVPIYDLNKNRWLFVEINSKVSSYRSKHSINSKGQIMTSALSAEVVGPTTNDMQLLTTIFRERGRDSCYSSISCIRFDRH